MLAQKKGRLRDFSSIDLTNIRTRGGRVVLAQKQGRLRDFSFIDHTNMRTRGVGGQKYKNFADVLC